LDDYERKHLLEPERNIPLDIFLRYYFLDNKHIYPLDRASIVDYAYTLTSYKLYLSAIAMRPLTWSRRLDAYMSHKFEQNLMNGDMPPNVRASFPEDLFQMIIDAYGEKDGFNMWMVSINPNLMITSHMYFQYLSLIKFINFVNLHVQITFCKILLNLMQSK